MTGMTMKNLVVVCAFVASGCAFAAPAPPDPIPTAPRPISVPPPTVLVPLPTPPAPAPPPPTPDPVVYPPPIPPYPPAPQPTMTVRIQWSVIGTTLETWNVSMGISVMNTIGGVASTVFDFGDGTTGGGNYVVHSYRKGTYSIGVKVTDTTGRVASDRTSIVVFP